MLFRRTGLATVIAAMSAALPAVADEYAGFPADDAEVIVVTAAGFEQQLRDAPASISVLTNIDLQQRQHTNIAEALADIPGVDIRNGVGKTGGLNIELRGMPADYTLILIDGRRQNTSGNIAPNGFGEFSTSFLPPLSAIERIEVIRGPMSTLYGSDAMGGVINIITKPVADEWGGNITADYLAQEDRDAADAGTINMSLSGPLTDNLGLQVRGRYFKRGDSERLNPNGTGRDPRPAEGDNYSVGGRLTYQMTPTHRTWVEVDSARQSYDNTDSRLGTLDTYNPDGTPNRISGYEDELRFYRDQIAAGHTATLGFGSWDTTVSHVVSKQEGRSLPPGYIPEFSYIALGGEPRKLENTDLVIESRLVAHLGDHVVTVGAEYKDSEVIDGAAGEGNTFEQDSWSAYLENEWSLHEDLRLTFGGRYENHSAFGGHFTPRTYLVWNSSPKWTLKGGVSTGYKVPTPNTLHDGITGFTAQGATVSLGSPHLKPEETTNYELSVHYDSLRNFSFAATGFLNEFKNKFADGPSIPNCLYTDDETPLNRPGCITVGNFSQQMDFSQQVNIDKAETHGVELTSQYEITPAWNIRAGYTWMETEVTRGANAGNYLVNNPKHSVNLSTSWRVTDRLNTWLAMEHKSSRDRFADIPDGGQDLAIYTATDNQLESYEVFNLGANYRLRDNLYLNLVVYNLFDKDFGETRPYSWAGETHYAYMYSHSSRSVGGTYIDGRRLWASLSYDF